MEYAVKYPENRRLVKAAEAFKREVGAYENDDWSKILIGFGNRCDEAQKELERKGVYPEFNDGNFLMFYLSPCTKQKHLRKLGRLLSVLPRETVRFGKEERAARTKETEFVPLTESVGRTCARECGLFPPCMPLLRAGEVISEEKMKLLVQADGTFGLTDGKILVDTEKI